MESATKFIIREDYREARWYHEEKPFVLVTHDAVTYMRKKGFFYGKKI